MNNLDYIKFVVSKVESELIGLSNSREYIKVITVLHALKVSDNILRDIYILSGIKKLRQLSSYLIFIMKKVESGSINIDNFIENYSADKSFIRSYFQTYYDLEQITKEKFISEEVETKFIFDDEETNKQPPVYSLAESDFKVADLDNELVTEEFRESTITENYSEPMDSYMSLVEDNKENVSPEDSSVFFTDVSDDVFNLPGEAASEREGQGESATADAKNAQEESATADAKNAQEESATADVLHGESSTENAQEEQEEQGEQGEQEEQEEQREQEEQEKQEGQEEISQEEEVDENEILQNLIPTAPVITEEREELAPEITESDREVDEKLQEIEKETSDALMNSEFALYEKFLLEKNKTLFGLFDDLILIKESSEPDLEMRSSILEEIFSIVEELRDYSERMSFEVITGVYAALAYCFDIKFKDIIVSMDNFSVFKKAIEGVEDLISGNDLTGFDIIVAKLNSLRDDLAKLLADRENFEKKKYDFGEEESNVIREFKDSSEYDAFIILRDKISELEETFQIIADMKDKTYPFESIRKLSVTFALFREIVNIARVLEMNKAAHLAEAGYIFVKFVQNYRIDPFKEEVSEVFKYLIYSFKLLYLDKPVKDFDKFVSYLNEPVKIFYPKNNKNE